MTMPPPWLPPLITLKEHGGDSDFYFEKLYSGFAEDFIATELEFRGMRVGLPKHPLENGKEAIFWHLTSEGKVEDERLPDLRRCERIRWPRAIIEHCEAEEVKVWKTKRGRETRICLWLEDVDYLVVLIEKRNYALLLTAYLTTNNHTRRKLQREYEAFRKAEAAH